MGQQKSKSTPRPRRAHLRVEDTSVESDVEHNEFDESLAG